MDVWSDKELDNIRNEHIRGTRVVQASKKTTEKRLKRYGEENERGARSEKNARCGHTGEEKKRKDACKRDMIEAGLKEENTTNRAEWRNKITSYTGDLR